MVTCRSEFAVGRALIWINVLCQSHNYVSLGWEDEFSTEATMKPLSEQLADLSVRVKNTEDAAAAAQKEAHDKVVARVAEAQAAAEQAVQKINQNVQSASDTASAKWNGLKAKIAADMADLKSKVAERKHDLTVKRAANYSQLLDEEASFAIDYAIASIEQAKVAVLDAIAGRLAVEKAKRTAA